MSLEKGFSLVERGDSEAQARCDKSREVFGALKDEAWFEVDFNNADGLDKKVPKSWEGIIGEEAAFYYDPKRVEVMEVSASVQGNERPAGINKSMQDWQRINTEKAEGEIVYARPLWKELNWEPIAGAEISSTQEDKEYINTIKIGTLRVDCYPLAPDEGQDIMEVVPHIDEAILIDIRRADETLIQNPRGKHPHLARSSFMKEMKLAMEQIRALGYRQVVAHPSDERRKRIYGLCGMEAVALESDWMVGDIDEMMQKRIRKKP